MQDGVIGHVVIETSGVTTAAKPALPEVTDVTILDAEKPVATSSPKAKKIKPNKSIKNVPDTTLSPETGDKDLLLDETLKSLDVVSSNTNSVNVASVNPPTSDGADDKPGKNTESTSKDSKDITPSKPKRGEFHTQIVGIQRQ